MTSLGIKLEIAADTRREEVIRGLVGLLDMIMDGGDKATLTVKHERPTYRGKQQVITTTEWEAGQDAPSLLDLGLVVVQQSLFETTNRLVITRIPCRPGEEPDNTLVDLVKQPISIEPDGALENVDPRRAADTSAAIAEPPEGDAATATDEEDVEGQGEDEGDADTRLDLFRRFVDDEIDGSGADADANDNDNDD